MYPEFICSGLYFIVAICSLPKEVGPCRGSFTRWYYDTTMLKCLPFTYGRMPRQQQFVHVSRGMLSALCAEERA